MIKGAILDLDGTLLDSMFIWESVGEAYLRSMGREPGEDFKERVKTLTLHQAACYLQREYGIAQSAEEIINSVNGMVGKYYIEEVQMKPGAPEFLQRLKENGVRMCIATTLDRDLAGKALKRCGVDGYFTEIITCASVGHSKEEPVIYREALKCLGTDRKDTVVFEDALFALRTAKADGFVTVGVFDLYESRTEEIRTLADFYITRYADSEAFWEFASAL